MERCLCLDGGACVWLAFLLLLLPPDWLVGAALAGTVHELSHFLAARALGIRVHRLSLGAGGCRMDTAPMTPGQELICAAAGPAGSLMLALLLRYCPQLALCGLIQGLWNLLPVYPLDGGRILRCIAGKFFPGHPGI